MMSAQVRGMSGPSPDGPEIILRKESLHISCGSENPNERHPGQRQIKQHFFRYKLIIAEKPATLSALYAQTTRTAGH
jgi:hypothetical protein